MRFSILILFLVNIVPNEALRESFNLSIVHQPDRKCLSIENVQSPMNSTWNLTWSHYYELNFLGRPYTETENYYFLSNWQPVIGLQCAKDTQIFLSSLVYPKCEIKPNGTVVVYPPCRDLCEQIMNGCSPSMNSYGFDWPYNCSSLLSNDICVPQSQQPAVANQTKNNTITDIPIISADLEFIPNNVTVVPECKNASEIQTMKTSLTNQKRTICRNLEWNSTYETNWLGLMTDSVLSEFWMGTYEAVVGLNCSPNAERFFCSLATPMCHENNTESVVLLPCRELCESVREGCEHFMVAAGFIWPYPCQQFPPGTPRATCVPTSAVRDLQKVKRTLPSLNNS